jgi:hypothetical protein
MELNILILTCLHLSAASFGGQKKLSKQFPEAGRGDACL